MVRIHLSDGSFFSLQAEVAARGKLAAGQSIDGERVAALQARSEILRARSAALRLISRAAHTRRGLARKLRARSFGPDAVRAALARMGELGYLDDRVFAEDWTRSRLASRTEGWKSLYRGLLSRGVPRTIAEETLARMFPEEEEQERARRCAKGLSRRAAVRRLVGRGFRSRVISRVLRELGPEDREEPAE
ncbi:MAG TPA: RecX family transcriptional regulator [Spirochaetia bacterium]|nr:RecX family transcriptional regulator [Spirochaetia bacterium]